MKRSLAIDPGDTTGAFLADGLAHLQMTGFGFVSWLSASLDRADFVVEVVVLERMNLRDPRARSTSNLQRGLDVIGCVRWLCSVHEVPLVEQWNRDKNQVSDDLLDEHGMLMRPKTRWRHANDAARHALYYETSLKRKGKT